MNAKNPTQDALNTCPRCGAEIHSPLRPTCAYCGAVLREAQKTPPLHSAPSAPSALPAGLTPGRLPPEYSHLKRPEPGTPLENAGCLLIFGLVWTVFSVFLVIALINSFVSEYIEYYQLSRQGISAQATVTWLETQESDDSTSYYVYYEFIAHNVDAVVEDSDRISSALYSALKIEQKIEILYLPTHPTISAVLTEFGPPNSIGLLFVLGIGGVFVLAGVGLLYAGGKTQKQLNQLRAEGLQTQGVLFERWTDKDSEGDTTYYVAFAFKPVNAMMGAPVITRAEQNKKVYDKYRVGDSLSVRYLPSDPTICIVQVP